MDSNEGDRYKVETQAHQKEKHLRDAFLPGIKVVSIASYLSKELCMSAVIAQIVRVQVLTQEVKPETRFIQLDLIDEAATRRPFSISLDAARAFSAQIEKLLAPR